MSSTDFTSPLHHIFPWADKGEMLKAGVWETISFWENRVPNQVITAFVQVPLPTKKLQGSEKEHTISDQMHHANAWK